MQGESVEFFFFVSQCILGSYLKKLCTTESIADSLSGRCYHTGSIGWSSPLGKEELVFFNIHLSFSVILVCCNIYYLILK